MWLLRTQDALQENLLIDKLTQRGDRNRFDITELNYLLHLYGSDYALGLISLDVDLYVSPGPRFSSGASYATQAEIAALGLGSELRGRRLGEPGVDSAFLQVLRIISRSLNIHDVALRSIVKLLDWNRDRYPKDTSTWPEFVSLLGKVKAGRGIKKAMAYTDSEWKRRIDSWIDGLNLSIKTIEETRHVAKSNKAAKQRSKESPRRRKP